MHIELAIFSAVPVEVGGQIQPKCTDALILPQANKNKGLSSVNYHLQVRMGVLPKHLRHSSPIRIRKCSHRGTN